MATSSAQKLKEATDIRMTHTRNVLIVGKTGSGKSTLANRIVCGVEGAKKDEFQLSDNQLGSVTAKTEAATCIITAESDSYEIQVIDTVGFFDTRSDMSNAKIVEDIKGFFRKYVKNGIHLVFFVINSTVPWTSEQQKTMNIILEEFRGDELSDISALVFTGCETLNDDSKQALIEEFKRDKHELADFMKKGVFTVGFPKKSKTIPGLWQLYEKHMEEDVKQLRNVIYEAKTPKLSAEIQTDIFWKKSSFKWCTIL